MKLKWRVTSLLTLLVVCCLFVTFKLFTALEKNVLSKRESEETLSETPSVATQSSRSPNETTAATTLPPVLPPLSPWEVWSSWVQPTVLYPIESLYSPEMNAILSALESYPITKFSLGHRGTQLKTTMYLSGKQRTVFKPKRFSRSDIADGPSNPYAGYDRHNGEIAAFHLDGILGFGLAPPVAGRVVNLTETIPVTDKRLFETYVRKNGNICFYGKCHYCKPSDLACADKEMMEGSVTIWLPEFIELQTWRHPYQRTYVPGHKALWEKSDVYCKELLKPSSKYYHLLPDILDTSVFDYLIGNADRHHFETFADTYTQHKRLLHIDSGKSFGNPEHDEKSILAPLRQCCKLRNSTWSILQSLNKGPLSTILDDSLQRDKLYPILTHEHLQAIDRRLNDVLKTVEQCIQTYGPKSVLFDVWV